MRGTTMTVVVVVVEILATNDVNVRSASGVAAASVVAVAAAAKDAIPREGGATTTILYANARRWSASRTCRTGSDCTITRWTSRTSRGMRGNANWSRCGCACVALRSCSSLVGREEAMMATRKMKKGTDVVLVLK
jgi:hypothetical protein